MAQEALKQVHAKVKSVLAEDVSTWTKVETKTEGATLCERIDGTSKVSPHPELRVGRAQMTIEAPPSVVLDVVWNLEAMRNWDGPTIADAKLVDEIEKDKTQVKFPLYSLLNNDAFRAPIAAKIYFDFFRKIFRDFFDFYAREWLYFKSTMSFRNDTNIVALGDLFDA